MISTLQLQVCEIFSYLQWILTDVRILLCQLVFEDSMERPVKDNQHVLCQETCSYNNFMQENTMQDVIPNSNEPPMVHSTSRGKLSSTFLSGGGEKKELISRKEEVLAIVSEMAE